MIIKQASQCCNVIIIILIKLVLLTKFCYIIGVILIQNNSYARTFSKGQFLDKRGGVKSIVSGVTAFNILIN